MRDTGTHYKPGSDPIMRARLRIVENEGITEEVMPLRM